jgi:hypothetical protein
MIGKKVSIPVATKWRAQKAKLKSKFPKLTDAELDFDETRIIEMLISLQPRVGKTTTRTSTHDRDFINGTLLVRSATHSLTSSQNGFSLFRTA